MATLIEITQAALQLEQRLIQNGGELTEELNELQEIIQTNQSVKLENYNTFIDSLEKKIELLKEKEDEVKALRRSLEKASDHLELRIKNCMSALGKKEIEGLSVVYKLAPCAEKLVIDEEMIPVEFTMQVVKMVPDKERIKAALLNGEFIEGASLEGGQRLIIGVKK